MFSWQNRVFEGSEIVTAFVTYFWHQIEQTINQLMGKKKSEE